MLLPTASPARTALPAAHFDRNATTPVTDLVHLAGGWLLLRLPCARNGRTVLVVPNFLEPQESAPFAVLLIRSKIEDDRLGGASGK